MKMGKKKNAKTEIKTEKIFNSNKSTNKMQQFHKFIT